jgi:hypothetical protein
MASRSQLRPRSLHHPKPMPRFSPAQLLLTLVIALVIIGVLIHRLHGLS